MRDWQVNASVPYGLLLERRRVELQQRIRAHHLRAVRRMLKVDDQVCAGAPSEGGVALFGVYAVAA